MFHAGLEMRIYCWNFEFEHFHILVAWCLVSTRGGLHVGKESWGVFELRASCLSESWGARTGSSWGSFLSLNKFGL